MQQDVGEYGLPKVQTLHITVNVLEYPLTVHFIRNTCRVMKLSSQLLVAAAQILQIQLKSLFEQKKGEQHIWNGMFSKDIKMAWSCVHKVSI